jgi:hypothetical protein
LKAEKIAGKFVMPGSPAERTLHECRQQQEPAEASDLILEAWREELATAGIKAE